MNKLITYILMFLLHHIYLNIKNDLMFINGKGNKYPRYLIYTEKITVREQLNKYIERCDK